MHNRSEGEPTVEQKVVVHTLEGQIHKGVTRDFRPDCESFFLLPAEGGGIPRRFECDGLKALFYVKDFIGNREYNPPPGFGTAATTGQRCVVTFSDGEVVYGSTPDYDEGAMGFTLYPSDAEDNNEKIFVFRAALSEFRLAE